MTIAIEPMITAGGGDVYLHEDGWSISAADESLTAHFEHTVAITGAGPRILTPNGIESTRAPLGRSRERLLR
jgi:methionyl aminopeptidase